MLTLNCKGKLLVADHPLVMGIINITPDSFYAGSRFESEDAVLREAEKMLAAGADLIDLGAQSTRPQSTLLTAEDELCRLPSLIQSIIRQFPQAIVSVDTFYSRVAGECVASGASVINDISGGSMDENMLAVAATSNVPYICMHMKGTPQTMLRHEQYNDIATEVLEYFVARIEACKKAGIKDVILDPGFGFSKNRQQNFELLRRLQVLKMPENLLMVGLSRKSTIYKTLGITAAEALNGTTVMNTLALLNGADMIRVHDVKEARECIRLFEEYRKH